MKRLNLCNKLKTNDETNEETNDETNEESYIMLIMVFYGLLWFFMVY